MLLFLSQSAWAFLVSNKELTQVLCICVTITDLFEGKQRFSNSEESGLK